MQYENLNDKMPKKNILLGLVGVLAVATVVYVIIKNNNSNPNK